MSLSCVLPRVPSPGEASGSCGAGLGLLYWVKGGMSHVRQHPRLETERLVPAVIPVYPGGCEPLFSLMRDREVNTFLPWFPLETEADAARYLEEHYLDYYRRPSWLPLRRLPGRTTAPSATSMDDSNT